MTWRVDQIFPGLRSVGSLSMQLSFECNQLPLAEKSAQACRARHCIRRVSQGGLTCELQASNMSPGSRNQEMFLLSPRNISVFVATNFVTHYKVSEVAKLRDIEGTCHARRISLFSWALNLCQN